MSIFQYREAGLPFPSSFALPYLISSLFKFNTVGAYLIDKIIQNLYFTLIWSNIFPNNFVDWMKCKTTDDRQASRVSNFILLKSFEYGGFLR